MALDGVKVVELAGLAPAPFCGMVLADFGASVIRIDKIGSNVDLDCLGNGKQSIALDLKRSQGVNVLRRLSKESDVLIEPFRKGVMESLGLGPAILCKENPRLIYARLTGYGQKGSYSTRAGHDINYVGLSGLLSLYGRYGENPTPPLNTVADFAGGGLTCALGIILALHERHLSGLGQVVDCSMVEGSAYLGSWLYRSQKLPIWGNDRGKNILDTGAHFYETYRTKDNKYVAVGAIEPQFYAELLKGLGLTNDHVPQFGDFDNGKKVFTAKFLEKTQDEWCEIFDTEDACVTPVVTLDEAPNYKHNVQSQSFVTTADNELVPNPAPKLSRTPGKSRSVEPLPGRGQHTVLVLKSLGYTSEEIEALAKDKVIELNRQAKL